MGKITNPIELYGYKAKTTFWQDFTIADAFGKAAVVDTYKRAMRDWKSNYIYLTELVLVLNHKIWQWHLKNTELEHTYHTLWSQCSEYAETHLKGDELMYFYDITD